MRGQSLLLSVAFTAIVVLQAVSAAEPAAEDELIPFVSPFATLTAKDAESKLVFLLVSDQPAQLPDRANAARGGDAEAPPDVWFLKDFQIALKQVVQRRPDLKDRMVGQQVFAGLPSLLNGSPSGRNPSRGDSVRSLPSRGLVLVCDGNYRLLSFLVGVPQSDSLARLIEDSEETRSLLSLQEKAPQRFMTTLINRARGRVTRNYDRVLAQWSQNDAGSESLGETGAEWQGQFRSLVTDLRPIYLFDVKLRFALSDASDLVRLIILEQHCETRRDWCDSVIPWVAGRPTKEIIQPLVECIWEMPAVIRTGPGEHAKLLEWFDSRRAAGTVTLAIHPDFISGQQPWPPPETNPNKIANRGWPDLEALMGKQPIRMVNAAELAVVLAHSGDGPINLTQPTRGRYVVFTKSQRSPVVIRESDLPGKFFRYFKGSR